MATQGKQEGTHSEDKSVVITIVRRGKCSTRPPCIEIPSCMERTHAWIPFDFGTNNDNLRHFNEDDLASLCEGIYLHHPNSSYSASGSGGMHGMWHSDKGFRMISGSTTRELASINKARRRSCRQYKNGGVVVRGWAVKKLATGRSKGGQGHPAVFKGHRWTG